MERQNVLGIFKCFFGIRARHFYRLVESARKEKNAKTLAARG
jgi:hypothetical protein